MGEMHAHDGTKGLGRGKADEVEKAAAQKGVGQFFFVVGRDDDHGAMGGADGLAGFVNMKLHPVQFLQQVVGKFDVGFVDLVDQKHHAGGGGESLPQFARADVLGDIMHPRLAQLAIAQAGDGIIFVQALGCFGGGFDMPFHQLHPQTGRNLPCQFGFSGARFALNQQGPPQGHSRVDGKGQIVRDHIACG